jgi:hypothetical protein
MTRRRYDPPVNRDDYVTRWARILNIPFPQAFDATAHIDDDTLKDAVDAAEAMIRDTETAHGVDHGAYLDWVKGEDTTIRGITR